MKQAEREMDAAGEASTVPLNAALDDLKSGLEGALQRTVSLTESEVLAAGETLGSILSETQGQLRDLDLLTREFATENASDDSLATVASRLLDVLAETPKLFQGVGEQVAHLAKTAEKAHGETREILTLVTMISTISESTKLLAINTRIEAARLGANEKALAVLASEMRSLSDEVKRATDVMERLAESLTSSLPSVSTAAAQLLKVCLSQADNLNRSISPFRAAYARARESVQTALRSSRERGERIQGQYTEILQHLQFQDRASQQLRTAEQIAGRLVGALHAIFELVGEEQDRSALGVAILDHCREALVAAQAAARPVAAPSPPAGDAEEIQFL